MSGWTAQLYIVTMTIVLLACSTFFVDSGFQTGQSKTETRAVQPTMASGIETKEPSDRAIEKVLREMEKREQKLLLYGLPLGDPNKYLNISVVYAVAEKEGHLT